MRAGPQGPPVTLVFGAAGREEVPGVAALDAVTRLRFAADGQALARELPEAEILYGWDFAAGGLAEAWPHARRLHWVQWSGAGVDAALFPELVASDVVLTCSRGIFDQPMAEYVAGLVVALAKGFPETFALQRERRWRWRLTERLAGRRALVVGAGSIGRAIARVLAALGLEVSGVARRARATDPDFAEVLGSEGLDAALPAADFVVIAAPLTEETRGLFDARRIGLMRRGARLVNVGRGAIVDEAALVAALREGELAGAALDVFEHEPLPAGSPLWDMPQAIVSPHMSGDFHGWREAAVELFVDNVRRYCAGEPLRNVVDKRRGYAAEG